MLSLNRAVAVLGNSRFSDESSNIDSMMITNDDAHDTKHFSHQAPKTRASRKKVSNNSCYGCSKAVCKKRIPKSSTLVGHMPKVVLINKKLSKVSHTHTSDMSTFRRIIKSKYCVARMRLPWWAVIQQLPCKRQQQCSAEKLIIAYLRVYVQCIKGMVVNARFTS